MVNILHTRQLLMTAALLLSSISSLAYDFEVDGIYYNKLSDTEVETTWKTYFEDGIIFEITDYVGDVVVPESVTYDGQTYKVTAIGDKTFQYNFQVTSISLPKTITSIGRRAFSSTRGLTEDIIIPDGVTSIGNSAFGEAHVKTLVIPDGVTEIPYGICYGTRTIRSVKLPDDVTSIGDRAFIFCDSLETIKIPSKLTSIGESAFEGCEKFGKIELPDCLTYIGDYAFRNCDNLTFKKLPESLTHIGVRAFAYSKSLDSVTIPKGIKKINEGTFYKSGLKSVTFADNVDSIGNEAFCKCYSLESVNMAEGLLDIGKHAFYDCVALPSICIPASVTTIEDSAFYNCNQMKDLVIGNVNSRENIENDIQSTLTIGNKAFYNSVRIKSISVYYTTPPICGDSVFYEHLYKNAKLYIPEGTSEKYSEANIWKDFFISNNASEGFPSAINPIVKSSDVTITGYYGIDGQRLAQPQKGINIVRYSNGQTKKVVY